LRAASFPIAWGAISLTVGPERLFLRFQEKFFKSIAGVGLVAASGVEVDITGISNSLQQETVHISYIYLSSSSHYFLLRIFYP
jgi:hypothetical protein